MTDLIEDTKDSIRSLPIDERLRKLLLNAGQEAKVDRIRVTSGGQCAIGTCKKRTGSPRHDLGKAADMELWRENRALEFTSDNDLPVFQAFVVACARLGATGIGAGPRYMGPKRVHVGFGPRAVWGDGQSISGAPAWLVEAAKQGWASSSNPQPSTYRVVAREGVRLRAGPSNEFSVLATVEAGTVVNIEGFDGDHAAWARTDMEGDGLIDGHLHSAFLLPVDLVEGDWDEPQDDCGADHQDAD